MSIRISTSRFGIRFCTVPPCVSRITLCSTPPAWTRARKRRHQTVTCWQLTTYTFHTIRAEVFADCSGDSILAPLVGAKWTKGREARAEYNESIAPEHADLRTMGMSCLIQAREHSEKVRFVKPEWAHTYETDEALPHRAHSMKDKNNNFWWIELGGEDDSLADTEKLRTELLKVALGVWDHIKNHGDHDADNWELEWIGFLPGKRESRRYIGAHVLTQNDVESGGKFDDIVGYGGWTMDDHNPAGFRHVGEPTIYHPAPSRSAFPTAVCIRPTFTTCFLPDATSAPRTRHSLPHA